MDIRAALEQLDVVRPGSADLDDPDLADAAAALSDEEVRRHFEQRQGFDRAVGEAMRDVPVPDDLRGRILDALASADDANAERPAASPAVQPERVSRRRLLWQSAAGVAAVLAAAGVWWWVAGQGGERITLAELQSSAPYESGEVAALPVFAGAFDPQWPQGGWLVERRIDFALPARGFSVPVSVGGEDGADLAAVFEFRFRDPRNPRGEPARGVLLVLPASSVADPPSARSYSGGVYNPVRGRPHVVGRAWRENDLVYVCLVPLRDDEALARALQVPSA
jgi:hypothetical protein